MICISWGSSALSGELRSSAIDMAVEGGNK